MPIPYPLCVAIARAAVCAAIALCAACSPAPQGASAPAASVADAPTAAPDAIKVEVQYPQLAADLAPLERAMRKYAESSRAELAQSLRDAPPRAQNVAQPQPLLNLDFSVRTQTRDFISAVGSGGSDFGGAHPLPLLITFTQHLPSGKLVALGDLFADNPAALKALSAEARRRLEADFEARLQQVADAKARAEQIKSTREWIEKGTEPSAQNFANFLVDGVDGQAIGLTLMFPAYQVASYADGPQQVTVPAKVFYAQLKPEYRDAFAIDKEDIQAIGAQAPVAPRPAG